jgi:ParB family chromosome partitioning protein
MSAPKRGLGRGLDALLGAPKVPAASGLTQIRVDAIRPNPQQPRKNFAAAPLAELEQSIRELGVLVPIIVRPSGAGPEPGFELIAGERRWRAAAAARLETIPAIVRDADDRSSLELAV